MILREPRRLPSPSSPELMTSTTPLPAGCRFFSAMYFAVISSATAFAVSSPTPGQWILPSSILSGSGVTSGKTTSLCAI